MLLDVLRHSLNLQATRMGCGLGQCGACTVLVNGRAANACQTPLWSLGDQPITTLEGLGAPAQPHPLQTAFMEHQALQCGFCTSGMLMRAQALLLANPQPTAHDVKDALHNNLCRCGVQPRVVQAVLQAARAMVSQTQRLEQKTQDQALDPAQYPGQEGALPRSAASANQSSNLALAHTSATSSTSPSALNWPAPPAVLSSHPLLGQWLGIVDGHILASSGKADIGQGITHALRRVVAQTLGVPQTQIRMRALSTAHSPDEGVTSGSLSVQDSGAALGMAAAQLRNLALEHMAKRTGVPVAHIGQDPSTGAFQAAGVTAHYADLAQEAWWQIAISPHASQHAAPHTAPLTAQPGLPGQTTADVRDDVAAKVLGTFAFIQDIALPGMCFGYVGRPRTPQGQLVPDQAARLVQALQALPDVTQVVQDGQLIGVLARTEHAALQAAQRMQESQAWQDEAAVPAAGQLTQWLRSQALQTTVVHTTYPADHAPENIASSPNLTLLQAEFERPYLQHASIGLCCALAHRQGERLRVWSHSQGIFNLRRDLALALKLQPESVTVDHVQGAGCYGHNGADDVAFDAAWLATHTSAPVRVMWTRETEMRHAPLSPAMSVRVQVGVNPQGRIMHWTQEVWSQGHGTRPGRGSSPALLGAWQTQHPTPVPMAVNAPLAVGGGSERNAVPPYDIAQQHIVNHRVLAMPLRVSALRALGAPANVWAAESMMDKVAAHLGQDVFITRLAHLSDARARAVLTRLQNLTQQARSAPAREGVGWGLGYARYKNTGAYCAVWAQVRVDHAVRLEQLVVVADVGQVISETGVRLQLEGGALQAASWALREQAVFDAQGVQSIDFETYPIDSFADLPALTVEVIDGPGLPPLGAGECASGPTTAALASAVSQALGIEVNSLPLSAQRLMDLLNSH